MVDEVAQGFDAGGYSGFWISRFEHFNAELIEFDIGRIQLVNLSLGRESRSSSKGIDEVLRDLFDESSFLVVLNAFTWSFTLQ